MSPLAPATADCWNRIGVVGDQSCPKLAEHVHCHNCGVYAEAAQRSLHRPVDALYREQWAAHFRAPPAAADTEPASVLVFRIGREWLALPTKAVASVARQTRSHRLPHRSGGALAGIVNVNGKLYPAIALAALLGIDEQLAAPPQGRHVFARLLVMYWEGQCFALPVAELHGILRYRVQEAAAPAATLNKGLLPFLTGVVGADRMQIGVLDAALLGHHLGSLLR